MFIYVHIHMCIYVYNIYVYVILRCLLEKSKLIQHMAKENHICIKLLVNFLLLVALEKSLVQEVDCTGLN